MTIAIDFASAPGAGTAPSEAATNLTALMVAVRDDPWGKPQLVLADVSESAMEAALFNADGPVRILAASSASDVSRELSRELAALLCRQAGLDRAPDNPRKVMLQRAKDFVDEHLSDDQLSPEMVAQGIFISKRYLHVLFQDEGQSFTRYLINRRLSLGREQLREPRFSHLTVADVAGRIGFKDASHFARAFKARYGLTPSRFRRGESVRPHLVASEDPEQGERGARLGPVRLSSAAS
jgi:AraC-like DNA-binding protein